jgi:hypothetical protein
MIFMHIGAPAQAFVNSASVLYRAVICPLSGTTFPLRTVFPSWQDSQCLSHKLIRGVLEQLTIKQNEKTKIVMKLIVLVLMQLSSSFSVSNHKEIKVLLR